LYALIACTAGGAFLRMSGAVSFLLSGFNLLPVLPLDGGRLVALLLPEALARRLSLAAAILLLGGGAAIALRFSSFGLLLAGLWLFLSNLRVVVKR
jgi:Zn-dependent protease